MTGILCIGEAMAEIRNVGDGFAVAAPSKCEEHGQIAGAGQDVPSV